jgi:RNA polymerase sigma factor (sigma-70 family)
MKAKPTRIVHHPTYEQTLRNCERYILVVAQRLHQDDHLPDLLNEGRLGLLEAWKKFDSSTGNFHSYAASYIRYFMLNYLSFNSRTIRIPNHTLQKPDFYENVTISTSLTLGDESNSSTVGDLLEADEVEHWDGEHLNDGLDDSQDAQRRLLRHYLSELSDTYQRVILMRENDSMSFVEIGEALGMTKANASLSYKKGIIKLQQKFGVDAKGPKHIKITPNGRNRNKK